MASVDNAAARRLDAVTIGAIAVCAWALADLIHEGGGHGGACLLVGGKAQALTSAYFNFDEGSVSRAGLRFIAAGGSLLNVVVGVPLSFAARMNFSPRWRLFVWLLAALNLTTAFGYLLYSAVGGIGDWFVVIDGVRGQNGWRLLEAIGGAITYFYLAPALLIPGLTPLVGFGADREARARKLTLLPYLAGGITATLSGALNPLGLKIMLISSVAAAFGGASLLAWFFPQYFARKPIGGASDASITRSWGWIGAGAIALAIFVGVFGRGLRFL